MERENGFIDFAPERAAIAGLRTGVGDGGTEQVRQRVGEDQRSGCLDDVLAEDQIGKRAGQEDDARQRILEVQHRVQVTKALLPCQARHELRAIDAQDLRHAARPANALADMENQALGREAG